MDKLQYKLKLVKEVSLELSKGKGDCEKVVMWVMDSFSTLMSKALKKDKAEYDGVITTVFDFNTSIDHSDSSVLLCYDGRCFKRK